MSTLSRALRRFGRPVERILPGEETVQGFAIVQVVPERRERGRQFVPSPLGTVRDERFLYLGEPALSLENMDAGYLRCEGEDYVICAAQAVYGGATLSHWRAVLRHREEART